MERERLLEAIEGAIYDSLTGNPPPTAAERILARLDALGLEIVPKGSSDLERLESYVQERIAETVADERRG